MNLPKLLRNPGTVGLSLLSVAASLTGCAFEQLLSPIVHDNILARWRGDSSFRPVC